MACERSATEAGNVVKQTDELERKVEMRKQVVQRVEDRRAARDLQRIARWNFTRAMWKVTLKCEERWEMLLKKLWPRLKERC